MTVSKYIGWFPIVDYDPIYVNKLKSHYMVRIKKLRREAS